MQIIDLREVTPQQLDAVLQAEEQHWLDEMLWDYRSSAQLIRKFLESHTLLGCAAFADSKAQGYGFYVLEDRKALIGGVFALPESDHREIGSCLLEGLLARIRKAPKLKRIEAQLIPFTTELDDTLRQHGFQVFKRRFMLLALSQAKFKGVPLPDGMRIEPWDDRYFDDCARLIPAAYKNHVDGLINDQYRNESGAQKFLKNIVILPGCGQFNAQGSFVIRPVQGGELVAAVLSSTVSLGVAHITQICIRPEYQGRGLGTRLMDAAVRALRSAHFHALTLTVTSENQRAVALYERLGFRTLREFSAAVWRA